MRRRRFLQLGALGTVSGSLIPSLEKTATAFDQKSQPRRASIAPGPFHLENNFLAVSFSSVDGSLSQIVNKLTGEKHQVSATTFEIHTDHGLLIPDQMCMIDVKHENNAIRLVFEHPAMRVEVLYATKSDQHFLEKTISVANTGGAEITITDIITDKLRFTPQFLEAYAHDDGTDWKCPLNVFLRTTKGGLFLGIENPYFEMITPGAWKATRLDLRYSPRWILRPRETFHSEPSFLGVYKKENIYFFKGMQDFIYMTPKQTILDWGEVWAMQEFLCSIQPKYNMPFPGYYLRGNGSAFFVELGRHPNDPKPFGEPHEYWQIHSQARFEAPMVPAAKYFVDQMVKQTHIRSIDWGTIWLGHAGWLRESPDLYLEKLDQSWPIKPNPYWKEVVDYARAKGLGVGIMDEGGARDYMKDDPRWKILDENGRPIEGQVQLEGKMGRNCWANPDFAAWWVEIVSRTIRKYDVPIWGTDAGIIWWVPFDPPLICYAHDHGHPVGECSYYAWRNIMWASSELRRRHPRCALRNAGGMHRGYPWVLRDWVEFHPYADPEPMKSGLTVTDNIRFQAWHTHNLRFIPPYKSAGGASTEDRNGMAYAFFGRLIVGDHGEASMSPSIAVTDPQEQKKHLAFFQKWAAWADEHVEYMRVRRDILGEPRLDGLDGTSHCIGDQGFLFLFNAGSRDRAARIPLNSWIGLNQGGQYALREIYPAETQSYGVYQKEEELLVPIASHSVVVIEIQPARGDESGGRPQVAPDTPIHNAFLNAKEVRARLGDTASIPGEPKSGG